MNKFGAKRTDLDGRSFHSKGEANCYVYLRMLERSGEISDLKCQVQVTLTKAKILMKPDFSWTDTDTGQTIYGEFKGFETPEYRIKRRLWKHYGPGSLVVFRAAGNSVTIHETVDVESDLT